MSTLKASNSSNSIAIVSLIFTNEISKFEDLNDNLIYIAPIEGVSREGGGQESGRLRLILHESINLFSGWYEVGFPKNHLHSAVRQLVISKFDVFRPLYVIPLNDRRMISLVLKPNQSNGQDKYHQYLVQALCLQRKLCKAGRYTTST